MATGEYRLLRGLDPAKDQSYFLFTLDQAQLAHAMFPVGAMDKAAVRDHARELGLSVSEKPDSHEICFVPDGDHAAFLERQGADVPGGTIQNVGGEVVGHHDGVHHFTVGQRKGLGLSSPVRLYVVGIDAAAQTVTVGPREALERHALDASRRELDCGSAAAARHTRDRADPAPPPPRPQRRSTRVPTRPCT